MLNLDHSRSRKNSRDDESDFFSQFKPSAYARNRKMTAPNKKQGIDFFHNQPNIVVNRPKLLDFSEKKPNRGRKGSAMFEEDANLCDMQIENMSSFPDVSDFDPLNESIRENKVIRDIKNRKKISKHPYKVLDAPGLQDDFYQVSIHLHLAPPNESNSSSFCPFCNSKC